MPKLPLGFARFTARLVVPIFLLLLSGSNCLRAAVDLASRRAEVFATEQAFADTLAKRDFVQFCTFIDEEAVFRPTEEGLVGKAKITEHWKAYFQGEKAPFSWRPGDVHVLASGDLALSNGPVFDPAGNQIWTFTSIWRRNSTGRWLIIFDQGNPLPQKSSQDSK